MRSIGFFIAGIALVLACSTSSAQVRKLQSVGPMPASAATVNARMDRQGVLERRVLSLGKKNRALEGRVATLESALREMRAASEFTCTTSQRSTNGRGNEECAPFACNYLDGRCRTTAATSDHCAVGFVWNGSGQCVAPPPAAEEDECFLFFC